VFTINYSKGYTSPEKKQNRAGCDGSGSDISIRFAGSLLCYMGCTVKLLKVGQSFGSRGLKILSGIFFLTMDQLNDDDNRLAQPSTVILHVAASTWR